MKFIAPLSGTVLVADDNATNRELLEELLASQGFTVVTASDGAAALRELSKTQIDWSGFIPRRLASFSSEFETTHVRHFQVEEDSIKSFLVNEAGRFPAVAQRPDFGLRDVKTSAINSKLGGDLPQQEVSTPYIDPLPET